MSADAFTLGALVIAVLPAIIPPLIEFLKEWRLRNSGFTVTVKRKIGDKELEFTVPLSLTKEQLKEYIQLITYQTSDTNDKKGIKKGHS